MKISLKFLEICGKHVLFGYKGFFSGFILILLDFWSGRKNHLGKKVPSDTMILLFTSAILLAFAQCQNELERLNIFKVNNEDLMSPCRWDHSGGYSCTWICFNIYLSKIYFIWCTERYTLKRIHVTLKVKRSTKLWGAQRSSELAFRSMGFCVPEDLILPALFVGLNYNS